MNCTIILSGWNKSSLLLTTTWQTMLQSGHLRPIWSRDVAVLEEFDLDSVSIYAQEQDSISEENLFALQKSMNSCSFLSSRTSSSQDVF